MTGPTGWWPDPSGRHPFRYFEEGLPTDRVSDHPVVDRYPSSDAPPLPPLPTGDAPMAPDTARPTEPAGSRAVGWYRSVADRSQHRHWDGQQWADPTTAPSPALPGTAEEARPSRRDRRRRPPSVITIAEALAIAVTLAAVITFATKTTGPAHSPARSEAPRATSAPLTSSANSPSATTLPTTTALPSTALPATAPLPSVGQQVAQWWAATGAPKTSALTADLQVLQADGADTAQLATHCTAFTNDATAAGSAAPAPSPAIQREWQLTLSTAQRVSAACAAQRYSRVSADLQPAIYTIGDLTHQVGPYLSERTP